MGQCEIVDPAASWKLIFWVQPHARPATTLNSFGRCLQIIDTFRDAVHTHRYLGFPSENPSWLHLKRSTSAALTVTGGGKRSRD